MANGKTEVVYRAHKGEDVVQSRVEHQWKIGRCHHTLIQTIVMDIQADKS